MDLAHEGVKGRNLRETPRITVANYCALEFPRSLNIHSIE